MFRWLEINFLQRKICLWPPVHPHWTRTLRYWAAHRRSANLWEHNLFFKTSLGVGALCGEREARVLVLSSRNQVQMVAWLPPLHLGSCALIFGPNSLLVCRFQLSSRFLGKVFPDHLDQFSASIRSPAIGTASSRWPRGPISGTPARELLNSLPFLHLSTPTLRSASTNCSYSIVVDRWMTEWTRERMNVMEERLAQVERRESSCPLGVLYLVGISMQRKGASHSLCIPPFRGGYRRKKTEPQGSIWLNKRTWSWFPHLESRHMTLSGR